MRRIQMQNMPRHDPVPPRRAEPAPASTSASAPQGPPQGELDWPRYKRMMKWMGLASALAVAAALAWLGWATEGGLSIAMAIATVAGVGLSVLLGTALMGLVFLSNRSGHDEAASRPEARR